MRNTKRIFLLAAILLMGCILLSLGRGTYTMNIKELVDALLGRGDALAQFTLFQLRLPRVVLALLVASALAVAGAILQIILRNPLAEPGMMGINAGAAFAVVLLITSQGVYDTQLSTWRVYLMPIAAFLGAGIISQCIVSLSKGNKTSPQLFLLIGVGLQAGVTALLTIFQLHMQKGDFNQVLIWTNGSLWGSNWRYIFLCAPLLLILLVVAGYYSRTLDVLALPEESAISLGVDVIKQRRRLFYLAAGLAGLASAVVGNIAFLGLLGPHIARRFVGTRHHLLFPLSAMIAASILLLSDLFARTLFAPLEIPVGIFVALIGIPYFLYLMIKQRS